MTTKQALPVQASLGAKQQVPPYFALAGRSPAGNFSFVVADSAQLKVSFGSAA